MSITASILLQIEPRIERRAARSGDAMHRPRSAVRGERRVIERVPVARRVDAPEARRERVDRREDALAGRHRERTAGQEVVLHVDDDQRVVRPDGHGSRDDDVQQLVRHEDPLAHRLAAGMRCTPLSAIASA